MSQKEWSLAPQAPAEHLRRYEGFSPILAQVLFNRGFEDPAAARGFVNQHGLDDDPFALQDMDKAVARINHAIERNQSVAVYGDFDADGVCATVLMTQALEALGARVLPYIPNREDEGYGVNRQALQRLEQLGIKLVVTVDCGIRSVAEVISANQIGLDVIITDHHSIGPDLPPALAVVNPRREDCPGEAGMAGVAVAFMLAKALLLHRWRQDRDNYPKNLRLSDLLDLAALGTVADVMPLNVGFNRRLIRHGLETINQLRRPGIAALAKVAGLKPGAIRASHLGFALGPRINAAGRLGSAMSAYELLSAKSRDEAMERATELQGLNNRRRALTREAQAAISEQVVEAGEAPLIFAGDENILPGIVGLVAGRLAEEFYRPAVVYEIGAEQSRASCRSIPEFDITRALDECADLLLRHGGHAMAAGFTVSNDNIIALRRALVEKARTSLSGKTLKPTLAVDCAIDLSKLNVGLLAELDQLEPTGHGNPPATFVSRNLDVLRQRRVGAEGDHLKLSLGRAGSAVMEGIGFGLGHWSKSMPRRIDAVYQLEVNEWQGRRNLQLRLLDIRPADSKGQASRA